MHFSSIESATKRNGDTVQPLKTIFNGSAWNHGSVHWYDGIKIDTFEHKFMAFQERCDQKCADSIKRKKVLSVMFIWPFLQLCFQTYQVNSTITDNLFEDISNLLLMKENMYAIITEEHSVTLRSIPLKNKDKKATWRLTTLFTRLW